MKSGPLGGDAQIASMIADGEISGVVFFIDPLEVQDVLGIHSQMIIPIQIQRTNILKRCLISVVFKICLYMTTYLDPPSRL